MPGDAPSSLPMVGVRPERADAAVNRERILDAARSLLARGGAEALRMDAVAEAAGVGKGTIFRRFGDRAGLVASLIDEAMRRFQEDFLHGPPPLGPGAPAAGRLEAFLTELVRFQAEDLPLPSLMEIPPERQAPPATVTLRLHVAFLLRELGVAADPDVLATMLLSALAPSALERLGADLDAARTAAALLARAVAAAPVPAPG